MLSNGEVKAAFREILLHMERAAVRADAIYELMLERGKINKQELDEVMATARPRQQAKWNQIRAKVDSLLEESDARIAKAG